MFGRITLVGSSTHRRKDTVKLHRTGKVCIAAAAVGVRDH